MLWLWLEPLLQGWRINVVPVEARTKLMVAAWHMIHVAEHLVHNYTSNCP